MLQFQRLRIHQIKSGNFRVQKSEKFIAVKTVIEVESDKNISWLQFRMKLIHALYANCFQVVSRDNMEYTTRLTE